LERTPLNKTNRNGELSPAASFDPIEGVDDRDISAKTRFALLPSPDG
jgi:hypothetical protein